MKVEEYIWSLMMFLFLFLVHYCLGWVGTSVPETEHHTEAYESPDHELFKKIKLRKGVC